MMTILNVRGIHCPSCIADLEAALAIEGVTKVDVRLDDASVAVEHRPAISSGRLIAALQAIGYEATARS